MKNRLDRVRIGSMLCLTILFGLQLVHAQERFGGIMLYSVRESMAENRDETLQKVADIGYKNAEIAGYENGLFYGLKPKEFKKEMRKMGFVPISAHQGSVTLENADAMIADVKAAGIKYFVVPVPPMGMFTFDQEKMTMGMKGSPEELANILTTLGKKCADAGIELLYHNHDFEYKKNENGIVTLDYLLEHTDPKYVNFQMDLYWTVKAGADPVAYFEKYPGRFKTWHVKDMDDKGRFAPVGTGSIDFKSILAQKKLSGMKYYFVEQDMAFDGMSPFEAVKISHDNLKEIGFK